MSTSKDIGPALPLPPSPRPGCQVRTDATLPMPYEPEGPSFEAVCQSVQVANTEVRDAQQKYAQNMAAKGAKATLMGKFPDKDRDALLYAAAAQGREGWAWPPFLSVEGKDEGSIVRHVPVLQIEQSLFMPPREGQATAVVFHDGGEFGTPEPFLPLVAEGYGLCIIEHASFFGGGSTPTEAELHDEAVAVLNKLKQLGVQPAEMAFFGRMLGAALAAKVALALQNAQTPIKVLMVESAYPNMPRLVEYGVDSLNPDPGRLKKAALGRFKKAAREALEDHAYDLVSVAPQLVQTPVMQVATLQEEGNLVPPTLQGELAGLWPHEASTFIGVSGVTHATTKSCERLLGLLRVYEADLSDLSWLNS